jgi:hypothetical protein
MNQTKSSLRENEQETSSLKIGSIQNQNVSLGIGLIGLVMGVSA